MGGRFIYKDGEICLTVDKDKLNEALEKFGDKAAHIIAKDLKVENWDDENLKGSCPWHEGDSNPSFKWNPKNNSFHCFGCSRTINYIDHLMSFYHMTFLDACNRLFKEAKVEYRILDKGVYTQPKQYRYPHREDCDKSKVYEYLKLRKISPETIDYCNVGADSQGNIAFHYYDTNDVLVAVKYRPSRKVKKKENKEWCQKGADTTPVLFNMNKIDITQPLLITEGEVDQLSVVEAGFKNCVSVPFGAGNYTWIEQNFDWLEKFESIIIWSDNDDPGIKMRKEVISRLGDWRCSFIDLPKEIKGHPVKDANEVLYWFGKDKIMDIIEHAQEVPIKGVVDCADVEDYDLENSEGLYTHIRSLDDKLYKIVAGTVSIVTGSSGAGKSVLTNQIFIAESLNQGYDTYVFSGELPNSQEKAWINLVIAGREHVKMVNQTIHKIDKETKCEIEEWYRGRLFLHSDKTMDNRADTIYNEMEMLCRRRGVKQFVIDNMMMVDFECSDSELLKKQKEFMLKLIGFAQRHNAFVTVIIHPHKLDTIRRLTIYDIGGTGNLTNLAHYIFSLYRFTKQDKEGTRDRKGNFYKGKEPKTTDVALDVLKNRITGNSGFSVELNFDYPSYRFYENPSDLWTRYKWDKTTAPVPTYDPKESVTTPEMMRGQ